MQKSDTVRNAENDAFETAIGTSPVMRFRSGAMPANCAATRTGTILASLTLPSDWLTNSSGGVKSKSGTWQDLVADNSGLSGFYEIMDSTSTTCHAQGLLSQAWAASIAFLLNQQVNLGGNVYKITTAGTSASSGGPTGTGTGITDGTAVWAYVGPAEMIIDNGNIVAGQPVTVTAFSKTANGA